VSRLYRDRVTLNDDHGILPAHADRLIARLGAQTGMSTIGGTVHMQHVDFAKRGRHLSNHLGAARSLSRDGYYPSALVVVRAALEHHLLDRLLFLARHYLWTYGGVGKEKGRGRVRAPRRAESGRPPGHCALLGGTTWG
jgi:hypothetical protein